MNRTWTLGIVAFGLLLPTAVHAGDWPQFRYDAGRTAAAPDPLAGELHLQWMLELPAPRPAFPNEVRLRYDGSYAPVVLGNTLFVPSPVTDSVTALDLETGEVRWKFFAGGPVRFAPAAWNDSVFVVSDDGYLYCLAAATGQIRWKFRGLPADEQDRMLLGNGRLISLWPARGGPVVHEGTVYFAAGLWPADGVFVHALEAATGKLLWSNADSNRIAKANMDHGIAQDAGLTPQGYLAVIGGRLVVPCGAQLPAFLDLKTGELDTYCMGWGGRVGLPKGSWFVAGTGNLLSHSGDLYDISRNNEERFRQPLGPDDFKNQLYPGGLLRLQIDRSNQRALGLFRMPVLTPEAMYVSDGGIVAYDLQSGKFTRRDLSQVPAYRREDKYPDRWEMQYAEKWRLPSNRRVFMKAGPRLYAGGAGAVEAIQIPAGDVPPRVVWQATIEGTPHGMLAAAGKLVVVTREGRIYTFGDAAPTAVVEHRPPRTPDPAPDPWTEQVAHMLQATKACEGFAVVLGIGTGRLVEELVRQSELYVIAVDPGADKVAGLRQRLAQAGLYGVRASVHVGEPHRYPLPPYLANLVVCENPETIAAWPQDRSLLQTLKRLVRPYGGTVCLPRPVVERVVTDDELASDSDQFSVVSDAWWFVLKRPGPLPGSANWSHAMADAGNTGALRDDHLRSPLSLLWFDGALRWHRKPGNTEVRVAGGRVLVKAQQLHALDAFTGRVMWKTSLPFPHNPGDQLVALNDAVYVTSGRTCAVVEPQTGSVIQQFNLPAGAPGLWRNLRVAGERIVAQADKQLLCLDRRSGELCWKHECGRPALSVAVGGGQVFCSELADRRKGEVPGDATKLRAFDLASGRIVWQGAGGSAVRYSEPLDLLVTSQGIYRGATGQLVTATTGFDQVHGNQACDHLSIVGETLLWGTPTSFVAYNVQSGTPVGDPLFWVRRGCTDLRASSNLVTTRFRANCAYIDLSSRAITPLWNVRPGCNNNLFPADGLLNIPCLTGGCECNYTPASQAYAAKKVVEGGG